MKRFTTLAAMFVVLSLGHSVAFSKQPPTPVVRYQFRVEGAPLSGPYDLVQHSLHFAPGAATPWHTHPGLVLVTVVEGEQTFRVDGTEKVYKVGDSFTEMAGHVAQAHNTTAANTTVLVSYMVPDGAPLSTPQATPRRCHALSSAGRVARMPCHRPRRMRPCSGCSTSRLAPRRRCTRMPGSFWSPCWKGR